MSFSQKLAGIIASLPLDREPLFGGLIPRRIEERERPLERTVSRDIPDINQIGQSLPVRRTGMERVNDSFLKGQDRQGRVGPGVRFDYGRQELDLDRRALDLQREKFGYERSVGERELGLKGREQTRKETEDINRLKLDEDIYGLDVRKAALDEWRAKNPEGQIETDETGRIMVIDKRTGKSIDTGLKADQLSETDKLRIQHENRLKEIELRNKGRARNINPSQQRTAESDAYDDVVRTGKYKDIIDKGYVELSPEGRIIINRPGDEDIRTWFATQSIEQQKQNINDINDKIKEFEAEWKSKSEERMNKIFSTGENENEMVEMMDADGNILPQKVPRDDVERLKAAGGRVVGEDNVSKVSKPMPKMADDIELMYNDKGEVIGARNVKPFKSSK